MFVYKIINRYKQAKKQNLTRLAIPSQYLVNSANEAMSTAGRYKIHLNVDSKMLYG
jgi:hypothetical protein